MPGVRLPVFPVFPDLSDSLKQRNPAAGFGGRARAVGSVLAIVLAWLAPSVAVAASKTVVPVDAPIAMSDDGSVIVGSDFIWTEAGFESTAFLGGSGSILDVTNSGERIYYSTFLNQSVLQGVFDRSEQATVGFFGDTQRLSGDGSMVLGNEDAGLGPLIGLIGNVDVVSGMVIPRPPLPPHRPLAGRPRWNRRHDSRVVRRWGGRPGNGRWPTHDLEGRARKPTPRQRSAGRTARPERQRCIRRDPTGFGFR